MSVEGTSKMRIVRLVAGGVFLVFIVRFVFSHVEEFKGLLQVKPTQFLILTLVIFSTHITNGLRLNVLTRIFSIELRTREWFGLAMVNTLGNYLFFKTGTATKAVYLKKRHNFSYTRFVMTMGVSNFVVIFVLSLFGMASIIGIGVVYGRFNPMLLAFFSTLAGGIASVVVLSTRIAAAGGGGGRARRLFIEAVRAWRQIVADRKRLAMLVCIDTWMTISFALRMYFCFRFLGYDLSPWLCLLIAPLIEFSAILSLTPADIGVRETIIGLVAAWLGSGFADGVVAASLDRTVALLWTVILGVVFGWILSRGEGKEEAYAG